MAERITLTKDEQMDNDESFKQLVGVIREFQVGIMQLLPSYEAQVDEIIRKRVTDDNHIQHALDSLLDFAAWGDEGLSLFKRLCRYYYRLNPEATADYIYTYRDMYDNPSDDEAAEVVYWNTAPKKENNYDANA